MNQQHEDKPCLFWPSRFSNGSEELAEVECIYGCGLVYQIAPPVKEGGPSWTEINEKDERAI